MKFATYFFIAGMSLLTLFACQQKDNDIKEEVKGSEQVINNMDTTKIDRVLSNFIENDDFMGVSALVYRGNEEVYFGAFGLADKESSTPFSRNSLVNIYSMTKPVTGTVLMSLYEEGLFDLEAPLSTYLPEYSNMLVVDGTKEDGSVKLVTANREIKVIDIFRHTACFGYGWEGTYSANIMNEKEILDPKKPLSQFSQELAAIPLYCHPGEQWKYGVSVDVQARLAEVVSGKPYLELVNERVLSPLNMQKTRYFIPAEEKSNISAVYIKYDTGELVRDTDENVYGFFKEAPVQTNGGHGLVSTIDDYMKFALMLQNEGSYDGQQILKPETVALMTKDHLPEDITEKEFLPSKGQMGFGLNVAVRIAPPADESENYGAVGEFLWDGAASTLFWVDPLNDVTVIFFGQVIPFNNDAHKKFRDAVYEALDLK
ncbi:serine hydrolase domain-containing protein [Glaciecola petra]|uniref:Serine hydrolase n=1 Tax=Glaciecola petra TaxID=3075602 RepID=A0ABU2ZPI2_9ALTE|nr:serine hydrolase [Aestuariibacter sp. P117]MDT0594527.1 serine hydrolase [Aestuariibacter sp. P117]